MGYTCETCNGMGILNYDSDLPRFKQETCPVCEGEGVLYRKSFQEIKDELKKTEKEINANYFEPHKWSTLEVPKVPTTYHKGKIVHVCGIYFDENKKEYVINTAMPNNEGIENMILPRDLHPWAKHSIKLIDMGVIPFPCEVEFGTLPDGHTYAEIL